MTHVLLLYCNQWQAQSFWTASKEWSFAKNTHMGLVYPDSPTQGGLCLLFCKIGALASRWSQSSIPDWSWLQSFLSFHCWYQLWRRIGLTQVYLYKSRGIKGFRLITYLTNSMVRMPLEMYNLQYLALDSLGVEYSMRKSISLSLKMSWKIHLRGLLMKISILKGPSFR